VPGVKRSAVEGVSLGEALLEPVGSYTVAGRKDREGSWGGVAAGEDGGYAGERGLARRWGLDAGEWEEKAPWERFGSGAGREGDDGCSAAPLGCRETLGCWVWPFFSVAGDLLLPGLCDQRLRVATPSRKVPMFSTVPAAALDRRRDGGGGGVARRCGMLVESGTVSLSDVDRLTVMTDDEDTELLREDRRLAGVGSSVGCELFMASVFRPWFCV